MLSSVFRNISSLRRVVAASALLTALLAPSLASAQTETFESKNYNGACQSAGGDEIGYINGDKEWKGFRALDLVNYRATCGFGMTNGYGALGSTVGKVVALGSTSAYVHSVNPFVLNSMVAGAGWQNPTSLRLDFFLNGGAPKATMTIQLSTSQTGLSVFTGFYAGPTDFIMFTPTYPPVGDYSGDVFGSHTLACPVGSPTNCTARYESWYVDNLNFSVAVIDPLVAPEPATVAMIGVGLLAVGLVGRKRRKA